MLFDARLLINQLEKIGKPFYFYQTQLYNSAAGRARTQHHSTAQRGIKKHVSYLPALANISSASVFKPQLAKLNCRVSVKWRSIDLLHSTMRTYFELGYLVLGPHSPPTSAPYSHAVLSHILEQTCTTILIILQR